LLRLGEPATRAAATKWCYSRKADEDVAGAKGSFVRRADLCANRSESPVSALAVDRHERPIAAVHPLIAMLRCGPSFRTFAATAKSAEGREFTVRGTKRALTPKGQTTAIELGHPVKDFSCVLEVVVAVCYSGLGRGSLGKPAERG
jgi:hypothetical protein